MTPGAENSGGGCGGIPRRRFSAGVAFFALAKARMAISRTRGGKLTNYPSPARRRSWPAAVVAGRCALGLREKVIVQRRDVRIDDRDFSQPPRCVRGQLAGLLGIKLDAAWRMVPQNGPIWKAVALLKFLNFAQALAVTT